MRRGDRVGCYTIERRLGAGGMGEVWRARDERLGRDVAIKLLLPHPERDAGRVSALQDEARAAGALNHTNVLTVHDVGDHHGAPYLVTECLEGESLRARLSRGPLGLDAALDVAAQVARGLSAAHAHGIAHGDFKPENIFLVADGRVKILDFGLATLRASHARRASRSRPATPPLPMGTVSYMAPEQLRGEPADQRADVFALGVVLRETITGRRPGGHRARGAAPAAGGAGAAAFRRCLEPAPDDLEAPSRACSPSSRAPRSARARPPPRAAVARARRTAVAAIAIGLLLAGAMASGCGDGGPRPNASSWAHTVATPRLGSSTSAAAMRRRTSWPGRRSSRRARRSPAAPVVA